MQEERDWQLNFMGKSVIQVVLLCAKHQPSRITKFVECDTTIWDDQVRLFREAASFSPTGKIAYVVANAGVIRQDDVFSYSGSRLPAIERHFTLTVVLQVKTKSRKSLT